MVGNRIKEMRDRAGLTQKALADHIGFSTRALISLEQKEDLINKHLGKIAEATGSSIVELIGYDIPENVRRVEEEQHLILEKSMAEMRDRYEGELNTLRERIALLEDNLSSKEKTICSLEKLNRMLDSQLRRYEGEDSSD